MSENEFDLSELFTEETQKRIKERNAKELEDFLEATSNEARIAKWDADFEKINEIYKQQKQEELDRTIEREKAEAAEEIGKKHGVINNDRYYKQMLDGLFGKE